MFEAGYTTYTLALFYGETDTKLVETYRFKVTLKATSDEFLGDVLGNCQDNGEFMWFLFEDDIKRVGATTEAIFVCPSGKAMGWNTSGYGPPREELTSLVTEIDPYATVKFLTSREMHPDEVTR